MKFILNRAEMPQQVGLERTMSSWCLSLLLVRCC